MNLKQRFSKETMNSANNFDVFSMFNYSKSFKFLSCYKINKLVVSEKH